MGKMIGLVIASGVGCALVAALSIVLYGQIKRIRGIRASVAENIAFCVFIYYFVDPATRAVALPGLSKTDVKNIRKMDAMRALLDSGVVSLTDDELTVSKPAFSYLRRYAANGANRARKDGDRPAPAFGGAEEGGAGTRLLHTLKLPHVSDAYAEINFDMI